MKKLTEKEYVAEARERWKARQKFLKSGEIIHECDLTETKCGLSIYQWEEWDWEWTPLADAPDEVTCGKCLARRT